MSPAGPLPRPDRPLTVVVVAEHASARFGGEAALPLHYFRVLRRMGHRVWLVTHDRTRAELEALFPGESRIVYIGDSAFHRWMDGLGRRLPPRVGYWTVGFASRVSVQLVQRRKIRGLTRSERIDVIHQPMPVSPREPSLMYGFGVPVVIGPMNGGMSYPAGFRTANRVEQAFVRLVRTLSDGLNALMPGKLRAAVLLVANARTKAALPSGVRGRVVELVENGIDLGVWQPGAGSSAQHPGSVTRFVFMGRLIELKCVDLLIRAFARASRLANISLSVIGDGPEEQRLKALASSLGVSAEEGSSTGVSFLGWLDQPSCAARLRASDCLVMPSIHDCGGAVVLEAMAMAKPVIATAWGGPLDYLDPHCGILVPPTNMHVLVEGLATAMLRLSASPEERERMGAAARVKVSSLYDWDAKGVRILEVYADAIGAEPRAESPLTDRITA